MGNFQKVLVHSRSRTVVATLKEAHAMNKRFEVFVTESSFQKASSEKTSETHDRYVLLIRANS